MNPQAFRALKFMATLALAAILGGCAFGRSYSYNDAPVTLHGITSGGSVAVGVQDIRPYVVSGNKPDKFVGLMRGGFGNPFDVNTQSGGPLAVDVRDAIAKSLKAKGINVAPVAISHSDAPGRAKQALVATGSRRLVLVTLHEWKSDTMMNTSLYYDVALDVLDAQGKPLATNRIKGSDNLGNLGLDPAAGIASTFVKKVDTLFDDGPIVAALR